MKTIKTIGLVAMMMVVCNFAMANKASSYAAAKQNLNETIEKTVQNDLPKVGNYLYENNITQLNDPVKVIFKINEDQELQLVRVTSRNVDAANYLKDLFNKKQIKADSILTGKCYTLDVHVKFSAH